MATSSRRFPALVPRLAGCAALVAVAAGCDPCLTSERTQLTLTASFSGDPAMSSERSVFDDEEDDEFSVWRAAIANASTPLPAFGLVALQALDASGVPRQQLLLSLPLPLSPGQSLPIAPAVATQGRFTFARVVRDDPNFPLPADAVGLWFLSGPTPDDQLADRGQSSSGTATVTSVSPLRLHLTATVSYPAVGGRPATTFDGDIAFSVTETSMCAG